MKKVLIAVVVAVLALLPALAQARLSANHNQTAVRG